MTSILTDYPLGEVALVTDYVANGSFASLKANVTYRRDPDYAILVRLKDFHSGWKGERVYVDEDSYRFLKKSVLEPGDIVVANVGTVGAVFRVPDLGQPMTLGPNAVLVRVAEPHSTDFLFYMLLSPVGGCPTRRRTSGGPADWTHAI